MCDKDKCAFICEEEVQYIYIYIKLQTTSKTMNLKQYKSSI